MFFNRFRHPSQQPSAFGKRPMAERLSAHPAIREQDVWPIDRRGGEAEAAPQAPEPVERPPAGPDEVGRHIGPPPAAAPHPAGEPRAAAEAEWLKKAMADADLEDDGLGAADRVRSEQAIGHARSPNNAALALQRAFEEELGDAVPDDHPEPADPSPEPEPGPEADASGIPEPQTFASAIEELIAATDALDDVAVTIGRVLSIRGSVVWGALYDDGDGATARAARMGALVSMRGPDSRVFGIVNALERDQTAGGNEAERTIFEVQVLGEISSVTRSAGFQRGVSSYPPLDAPVTTVTLRDLASVYARPNAASVHVGRLRHNPKVPAFVLTDSLLGKHFAVLGTTGSGKSCAVTVILRSILDAYPEGHVILIDPHNEYASAFADRAELLDPSNLKLPYWLLNLEEIAQILIGGERDAFGEMALLKDAIPRAKNAFVGDGWGDDSLTVDTPVPYRLSDLIAAIKEGAAVLGKSDAAASQMSLIGRIEGLRADPRYAFMFQSLTVRDNMRQILAQLLRIPVEGKPITIIDISGVPSEIVDVVVSVLFRLTFELGVWSERGEAPPVLLVCEEAHRYVPAEETAGFAPTRRVISRIAKEGRKYGVTLCLVSQRPSELAISSLSQCNTIFALRMTNEHDQQFVGRALSENARWLVDGLPSLNTQEAVVVGDGVTVPVHIRFKDLSPEHQPRSGAPAFSSAWTQTIAPDFLDNAIDRWRRQVR